ncbi:NUDIX domain-containing protein [Williamsia deligens]|uniref:NUDIX domain-containing protein n=1 Tax=Williamsia deligens TaxID=321325 RepID=A0ABW3GAP5_9NOCA|nr:NUDIX domain-containing protein [Williamsia deligens]MCP2196154.1 NUDIX domain-containing protein [Williamsia deligens]
MTDSGDVSPVMGEGTFGVRAAAVVRSGDAVLTCAHRTLSHEFLPGGRVRLAESAFHACERELLEEIGVPLPVGPMRLMVENFFAAAGRRVHELLFCFDVDGSDLDLEDARGWEVDHTFRWRTRDDLGAGNFEPHPVVPFMFDTGPVVRTLVLRDGELVSA